MTVYNLMLFSSLIIIIVACLLKRKDSKLFYFLASLPLIIVAGLRYNVGADYSAYALIFNNVKYGIINESIETGFIWFIKLIQLFTNDYTWMFLIVAFITVYLVYDTVRKESVNPPLSIYLYITAGFYFASMNGMRQLLSVSIIFYALKYIEKRDFKKFLLCIIPAVIFHYSSIIYIFLYWLYGKKAKNSTYLIILTSFIIFKPVVSQIILFIVSLTKYSSYIGGVFDTNDYSILYIIVNLIILLFMLFYNRKALEKDDKYSFYCSMHLIYTILTFYIGSVPLISRLRWGVGLPLILLIPEALKREKNKKTRMLYTIIIIVIYFAYYYYTIKYMNYNLVLPFRWIFERSIR